MEVNGITLPGYRIYEYLLVLQPHDELRQKVKQVRKEFNEAYRVEAVNGGMANLALANFVQYEMMEERLLNRHESDHRLQ